MNKHTFQTNRLILKPIKATDGIKLYEIYCNPQVMKYIYDGSTFDLDESKKKANQFADHWQQHGFGMWLLEDKETNSIIGYAGFRCFNIEHPKLENKIELGYILDQPYWGQGFAKEAVSACVQIGINEYNFKNILATILPENIGSQMVATYSGLEHKFDQEINGLAHYVYEIST